VQIQVTDCLLTFDAVSVRYEHEYLPRVVLIDVLREWERRLTAAHSGQTIYLPFSLDDEFILAFEAEPQGGQLLLRVVKLDGIGYVVGRDPPGEAIMRDRRVVERFPAAFLTCDRAQLLEALERVVAAG
jgi:hypothetical protein